MNLSKLFELQRQLDERIEREHPRQEGEDRLAKKILALQVELGELANEWRGFKFWSHDQAPRIGIPSVHYDENLGHDVVEYIGPNTLLEEYVDCLHFILSIGNDIVSELTDSEIEDILFNAKEDPGNIVDSFIVLNRYSCELKFREKYDYISLLTIFLSLGLTFGFTWSEIEQAYLEKNAVNHQRQESGY
ncbi:dUTP diphosphatase [Aeribacillus composti]|uniref:dUTPase n=1 Tax=Anoxybacillus phage A403 TaxID=2099336 RepID=A0A2P1JTZ1_9CAUD|nr:nucleoside triphosphate pyrophosphohydrolase [Anoxybacillus phage A403]AVO22602.1 DUTPase [Anoxybacillus phage A403]